jgi:putative copper export protein
LSCDRQPEKEYAVRRIIVTTQTLYDRLLFVHVLGATAWAGGEMLAAERGHDADARWQLRRRLRGYLLIVLLLVVAAWDMTTKADPKTAG